MPFAAHTTSFRETSRSGTPEDRLAEGRVRAAFKMETLKRTHTCGELTASNEEQDAFLMGWVDRRRDHGQLIFVDLRDREGVTQVVFSAEVHAEVHRAAKVLRSEFVIAVRGKVRRRENGLANPNLKTGTIEIVADELWVMSEAKTTPFPIE